MFALNPNEDENVPPLKINHVNEMQSLANKFVRNVEEEMVEEPANFIFSDNASPPSLHKLSRIPATPLFDRQPEKRRYTFPSAVEEESSDNRQLISEITNSNVPALLTALSNVCQKLVQSNLGPPPVKPDPLKIQHESLNWT